MKSLTESDIIKGMPMPGRRGISARPSTGRPKGKMGSRYPLDYMEVGDSFDAGAHSPLRQQRVIGGIGKYQRQWMPEAHFVTRTVGEGKKKRIRVWRTR